jgi:tRNA(Ile)-lysidine synthase
MKHQKTIEQEVLRFIEKYNLLNNAKKILIALSGGADSVFALHFFYKFRNRINIQIAALHVNHKLRGKESKRDEDFCKSLCDKLKIEFFSEHVNVKAYAIKNKQSIEEAARTLRYRQLKKIAIKSNSDLIITAHNRDDNTETVILNLINGTGIHGLSGIPLKRGIISRPFLCLSKNEIVQYLEKESIKFVYDSSNENSNFRRNYLRNKIIPLLKENINPALDKSILNTSEVLKNQIKVIDFFIEGIISKVVKKKDNGFSISLSELKKIPEETWGEIIKTIFSSNFDVDFNFNQFEKIKSLVKSQVGIKSELGNKIFAFRERDEIFITKNEFETKYKSEIEIDQKLKIGNCEISIKKVNTVPKKLDNNNNIEFISGDNILNKMLLRTWEINDKIQLLGMKGTKKISDVLTDLKMPSYKRKKQLVLVNQNEIVWIVGKRISEKYKITSKTKIKLKLCLN